MVNGWWIWKCSSKLSDRQRWAPIVSNYTRHDIPETRRRKKLVEFTFSDNWLLLRMDYNLHAEISISIGYCNSVFQWQPQHNNWLFNCHFILFAKPSKLTNSNDSSWNMIFFFYYADGPETFGESVWNGRKKFVWNAWTSFVFCVFSAPKRFSACGSTNKWQFSSFNRWISHWPSHDLLQFNL